MAAEGTRGDDHRVPVRGAPPAAATDHPVPPGGAPPAGPSRPTGPDGERRARGIGLRGQIALALLAGLAIAVSLVGIAIDRLASRALDAERERTAGISARAAAAILRDADAPEVRIDDVEDALLRRGPVLGFEIARDDGTIERRGVQAGIAGEAPVSGGTVRVWVASASGAGETADGASGSLVRIVVLYAGVTSVAILVLCYVLLGRLIVAPVEELTRASERLARGKSDARAAVSGALEVQQLALVFNAMSSDLRDERAALEARLRELEKTTKELRLAQDSLVRSEKLASVGRLAAGVAHEIGNPISAILGMIELVRAGGLEPAEQAEFLTRIQAETERISRIIRDLLDFSRRGQASEVAAGSCDLGEVVESAVHLVAPQKDLRRITIERRIPEGLPKVRGDADSLAQVVLNLLLNAADAIEGEGAITIAIADEGGKLALSVSDTGPGVAAEVRDKLFEPFVTTKAAGRGTGLGLAVCRAIVERIGGAIRVEAAPTGGARFVVELPVAA
jgi:signal transduction histidine kinase